MTQPPLTTVDAPSSRLLAKGGRPSQAAAGLLNDSILIAALDHFVRHGWAGATMEGIAASAGVTKRTLYARYGSKDGLLRAVANLDSSPVAADIAATIPPGNPRDRILFAAQACLDVALSPRARDFSLLMEQLIHARPELIEETSRPRTEPLIGIFKFLLEEGAPSGAIAPDRLDVMAECLFDLLVVTARIRVLHGLIPSDQPEAQARHLAKVLDAFAAGVPALQAPAPFAAIKSGPSSSPPRKDE